MIDKELFRLDQKQFESDIRKIIAATGKKAGEVVRDEGRLFVQDVIRFTPPFGQAPSTESYNKQRKTGENAVARDIKRTQQAIDENKFLNTLSKQSLKDRIAKLIRKRDTEGLRAVLRNIGIPVSSVLVEADPKLHENARDRRGRVQRKTRVNPVLRGTTLRRYIKEKQAHVGSAKAGWMAAARGLGVRVPAWISRHQSPGKFEDQTRDPKFPRLTVGNLVDYIQTAGLELNIVRRALQNRSRNMKAKLERILNSGWKRR